MKMFRFVNGALYEFISFHFLIDSEGACRHQDRVAEVSLQKTEEYLETSQNAM